MTSGRNGSTQSIQALPGTCKLRWVGRPIEANVCSRRRGTEERRRDILARSDISTLLTLKVSFTALIEVKGHFSEKVSIFANRRKAL
jgi:hypothetical protein